MATHKIGHAPVIALTGANRGLGLGLLKLLLEGKNAALATFLPDAIVVATARDPDHAAELLALKKLYGARLDVVKLDVGDEKANAEFGVYVGDKYGRLDLFIANAGVGSDEPASGFTRAEYLRVHVVNAVAPAEQTRALLPVVKATVAIKTADGSKVDRAHPAARVVFISSDMGSVAGVNGGHGAPYRSAKASLNVFARAFACEHPEVAVLVLHPGWVATDMGCAYGTPPLSIAESSAACLDRIAEMTLASSAKALVTWEGKTLPW